MDSINKNKANLRLLYKGILSNLTEDYINSASTIICKNFKEFFQLLEKIKKINNVFVFYPTNNEVNISCILNYLNSIDKKIFLPVMLSKERIVATSQNVYTANLKFVQWSPKQSLKQNSVGILEPIYDEYQVKKLDVVVPDIIIMPLMAFDRSGKRLGKGGGYYDFTINHNLNFKNAFKICCAFSLQEAETIPTLTHDIKVNAIITEKEVIHVA